LHTTPSILPTKHGKQVDDTKRKYKPIWIIGKKLF